MRDIEKIEQTREKLNKNKDYILQTNSIRSYNIGNDNGMYKFFIGRGNNSDLVRRVMQRRINWREVPAHAATIHYRWNPTSRGIK